VIVGEDEVKADAFALKHLASGKQETIARGELAKRIAQLSPAKRELLNRLAET